MSHLCLCILPLSSLGKGKRFSYSHFAERCEASLGLEGHRDWYLMPAWLRLASFQVLRAMGRSGDLRAMHASQPPAVNPGMRPEMDCLQEDSSNKKGKPQKPGQKGGHNPPAWIVTTSVQGTEGRDGHLWGDLKTQKKHFHRNGAQHLDLYQAQWAPKRKVKKDFAILQHLLSGLCQPTLQGATDGSQTVTRQ